MSSQSDVHAADRPYLYLVDFLHRVHSQYTCAISLAYRLAAGSAHEETKNKRCWRAELIISELITNASRHAFKQQAGRISVAVETVAGQIICRVSDDGSPTATLKRGLGSELIDALAASRWVRRANS
jgi:anti-sigma regulatory factor (Ser/Thr protein kinase)